MEDPVCELVNAQDPESCPVIRLSKSMTVLPPLSVVLHTLPPVVVPALGASFTDNVTVTVFGLAQSFKLS